jgi:hypothetical protein
MDPLLCLITHTRTNARNLPSLKLQASHLETTAKHSKPLVFGLFFIGTERWNPTSAKWHSAHIHSSDSKPGRRELVDPTLPFVPCPVSEQLSDSGCCAMTPRKHSSTHSLDVSRLWLDPRWFPDDFQMISDSSISMDHKYPENLHMKHDQRPIKSPWKITPCHYVCCLNHYVTMFSHHFPYNFPCVLIIFPSFSLSFFHMFPSFSHHFPIIFLIIFSSFSIIFPYVPTLW